MNAHRLIEDARAAGLSFEVEDGDLMVEAERDPPDALIAELREHKAELIAVLAAPALETAARFLPDQEGDNREERAALVEFGADVPRQWAEGYAALCSMPPPTGFSTERWHRIVDAAGGFLDRWAAEAIASGWSELDLFGCDPNRPESRFDCMGLLMLLDRMEIIGIDAGGADLRSHTGAMQRYRRRP